MSSSSSDISVSAVSAPVLEQRVFLPHDQFEPHDAKGTFVKGADFQELYYYSTGMRMQQETNSTRTTKILFAFAKTCVYMIRAATGDFVRGVSTLSDMSATPLFGARTFARSHTQVINMSCRR